MGKLFGTDGIRGKADIYPMTQEMAAKVGFAAASLFGEKDRPAKILIGRDTRESGKKFENALVSGIYKNKNKAYLSGVTPTPGVSYLVSINDFDAGIVISASHNPYDDNGIKIFKSDGYKLSDKEENEIETFILDSHVPDIALFNAAESAQHSHPQSIGAYTDYLKACLNKKKGISLRHMNLVIDCANGATSRIAPELFEGLGADVHAVSCLPDGKNINDHCGSEHPEEMVQTVIENHADIGIAFDGDGDRLIAADETGAILTGDQILAILAAFMKKHGELSNNILVSTVMSNMGLGTALRQMDIKHITTAVGDRYVAAQMIETGAELGGEDSGHIILMDHHKTGDGMLAALKLLQVIRKEEKPLSELKKIMNVFPQELVNVEVRDKPDLNNYPEITKIINAVEKKLGAEGRVLVRYSGTQPICRIMVEGPDLGQIKGYCKEISDIIQKNIN